MKKTVQFSIKGPERDRLIKLMLDQAGYLTGEGQYDDAALIVQTVGFIGQSAGYPERTAA